MFIDQSGCFPIPSFMDKGKRNSRQHNQDTFKREFIFGHEQPEQYRKTVLLVGPKGSGKTALINSFANFINNVQANSPYRLHITPVNEKNDNSSMNYAPTLTVNTYVFQHTPLGFPVALVDTPSIGLASDQTSGMPSSAFHQIKSWFFQDYKRPVEDLEVWLILSAVENDMPEEAGKQLQAILDMFKWKATVVPVITFAKKRAPVLALKTLTALGFQCENEDVDYFTINNGSVLGLSSELLELNALSFDDCVVHMRELLLAHREPPEQADLMPLRITTSTEKLKNSDTSVSDYSDPGSCEGSPQPEEPLFAPPLMHSASTDLPRNARGNSERPLPAVAPAEALRAAPVHARLRSYDSAVRQTQNATPSALPRQRASTPQSARVPSLPPPQPQSRVHELLPPAFPRHQRRVSHDAAFTSARQSTPPAYDKVVRSPVESARTQPQQHFRLPPIQKGKSASDLSRCKSEDVVMKTVASLAVNAYETLV